VLCDLDGVVWLAHRAIPGSAEAVARLRSAGHRVVFVTNNSASTIAEQEAALAAVGIDASGHVVNSAMSAAALVSVGERALVCGGAGLRDAVTAAGAEVVMMTEASTDETFDAVVVGWHREFDYRILTLASGAVRRGARLLASNDDATYPTPGGPIPGGGAILAAVERAAGVRATIAGKPHAPMAGVVARFLGLDDLSALADAVMVGDRPETDGLFARTIGCRYGHVDSGVTPPDAEIASFDVTRDLRAADLAGIADLLLGIA
jgi:HAD superfamily hydrolase (TIGR01450 family)